MLPDNVLLEIFDFYRTDDHTRNTVWKWHLLVHVCRRWRQIIFGSPHRLKLRILCKRSTPVRRDLCIWPTFPIVMDYFHYKGRLSPDDELNAVAALKHPDRVCDARFSLTGSQLGGMATVMQEPFPVLTRLYIISRDESAPILPGRFLGGSTPCLQKMALDSVPYPTLPTLLLSASDLVELHLFNIPPTGYISPEEMVMGLAALPRLETFFMEFRLAISRPDGIRPPPATRTVLPGLTRFEFKGASEYLEALVAQIDSPQLDRVYINYYNQLADFRAAQLSQFIDRSVGPETAQFRLAEVTFYTGKVTFDLYPHSKHPSSRWCHARTTIMCEGIDWQASHIAQVLSELSMILSSVVHLDLNLDLDLEFKLKSGHQLEGLYGVEWLHLLRQFSTVKSLHMSRELARHVALALEDITGGMFAEALPSLDLIWLEGQRASFLEKFIAVRRFSDRPATVVNTSQEIYKRIDSYVGR